MNIKNKVRSAKCGVLGALVAVGLSAFAAEPSVTVGKVESGEPWSKITVNYTLGGTDAALNYKVAFDITAGGETASVTNDAAKLTDGAATKEIDTATLFGKEVVDTKAKVKVSLIAIKPKEEPKATGVQLWEGGPYWAECNIGATKPEDYGILTNFNDAAQAVTDALGNGWRLPTKAEFEALLANCGKGTWTEQNGAKGRLFTGTGDYSSNSIFLPAAGYDDGAGRKWAGYQGRYWSSGEVDGNLAWYLYFYDSDVRVYNYNRSWGFSVRAVRDTPLVTGPAVTVGGTAVGEVVRGEDGKTLSFAVAAGTVVGDVKLDIGGVDVTKGFRVTVNGTEARAVLLAPYEVPKEEGAADGIWTENGDGTVTLNVEVVPGLYYAADSAESLDALACPGASAPATGATTLTAPKPAGDKGFFKVWVSDAPIPAAP